MVYKAIVHVTAEICINPGFTYHKYIERSIMIMKPMFELGCSESQRHLIEDLQNSLGIKADRYLFNVLSITEHANLHLGARNVGKLDRAAETLVLLWVIVLQPNLEFNGLDELAILLLGISHDSGDSFSQSITLKLTAHSTAKK